MNYSDFIFWWILILFSVPFLTARYIAKSFNLWRGVFDGVGLAALSLILFYYASRTSFLVFIVSLAFNYIMVWLVLKMSGWKANLLATIVIVIDILVLAYFKYFGFFVQEVIGLFVSLPPNWKELSPIPVPSQIPPGVSFYTFQMVAFVVDSLREKKKKPLAVLDYVNFISFFPQIVAGPIERRRDLLPQMEGFRLKFTGENFEKGLRWLSLGLFMKFVLADNIAPYIELDKMIDNAWYIWFEAFLFTLRIYFDFGGYSFIAVGLAYFVGVRLELNFLAPYTSQSINEFWRRWHITLSTWFRDYVFLHLMGSNKNWAPFYLFITFTLSGFWHGAAWNFIFWGAYHGALLLLLRYLVRPFYAFLAKNVSLYLNTGLKEVNANSITVFKDNKNEVIPIDLLLWTAGTEAQDWINNLDCQKTAQGKLLTRSSLQLIDYPEVFALGDIAEIYPSKQVIPATAQAAYQTASVVAKNISAVIRKKSPQPYYYLHLGDMLTLGKQSALVSSFVINITGRLADIMRRFVYILRLPSKRHQLKVFQHWAKKFFSDSVIHRCYLNNPSNQKILVNCS